MYWKTAMFAAVAAIALAVAPHGAVRPAYAACDKGDVIDRSTANDAKKKFEAAGYTQLRDFKKGCDNYWHAIGNKGGVTVRVVVSPQGEVITEKD